MGLTVRLAQLLVAPFSADDLDLLPLPLDCVDGLNFDHAVADWVYCMAVGLNYLYTGCHRVLVETMWHPSAPSDPQRDVFHRLARAAERFLHNDVSIDVRAARREVPQLRSGYDGVEVAKAYPVSVKSILPALPPQQVAASVDVLTLVSEETRRVLLEPDVLRRPAEEVVDPLPIARVNVESQK
eukprot:4596318-Amphidinium_carterae.1